MVRGRIPVVPIAATTAGAVLRLLSPGLVGLWRDEAQFLAVTRLPTVHQLLAFLSVNESHPPLFYLLVRLWLAVAGDTDSAARIPPLIFSIALIPAVWFVTRRVFSDAPAALAAILVAVAPVLIFTSVQVRPYSLLTLLALAGTFALWSALVSPSGCSWAWYVSLSLLLVWTHNWAWLYLAGQGVLAISWLAAGRPGRARAILTSLVAAWLVIAVGYLPWAPSLVHQMAHAGHPARSVPVLEPLSILATTSIGSPALLALVLYGLLAGRGLLSALGPATAPTPDRAAGTLLLVGMPIIVVMVAQLLSPFTDLIVSQCVVTLAPFVAIGLALGLVAAFRAGGARIAAGYAVVLMLVLLRTGLIVAHTVKTSAATLARTVTERAGRDDIVIVAPEWYAPSFNHYFPATHVQWDFPSLRRVELAEYANEHERVSEPRTLAAITDSLGNAFAAGRNVWLVMDPDWVTDAFADLVVLPKERFGGFRSGDLVRSNQIRRELVRLYGAPAVTLRQPPGFENLCAMLFVSRGQGPVAHSPRPR